MQFNKRIRMGRGPEGGKASTKEQRKIPLEEGPVHKVEPTCLETKGRGKKVLRSHFDPFQLFASVNSEVVFHKEANLEP